MARGNKPIPPSYKKYGVPLYCGSWVPFEKIQQSILQQKSDGSANEDENVKETQQSPPSTRLLVFGGGGGEGRNGVPNALLLAQFDFSTGSLSQDPVFKLKTDGELPYRMAMHPQGEGLVCSFPQNCRWFEWVSETEEPHKLGIKSSGKLLTQLENVGLQLALSFNSEGSMLASGSEDGYLRVFRWPSMEVMLDQADAHVSVKDLNFSTDSKFLVSLGNSGPCRVWNLKSLTVVANLPRENGEMFGLCHFSRSNEKLYITAMKGQQGGILSWNTSSWKRIGFKKIVRDPISAFNVSDDGKFLAIGTIEGDIAIVDYVTMQVQRTVKKAHLGLVTALDFSEDTRALVSTSFDSSARVTLVEHHKQNGFNLWVVFIIILLAIAAFLLKESEFLLYLCPHVKKE